MSSLKYAAAIRAARVKNCPPADFLSREVVAFRLVRSDPLAAGDFEPAAVMKPERKFPSEEQRCSAWGLSFFNSHENVAAHRAKLQRSHKKFQLIIGDKIGFGKLTAKHGLVSAPNSNGHFTLHEFVGCELHKEFTIYPESAREQKAG